MGIYGLLLFDFVCVAVALFSYFYLDKKRYGYLPAAYSDQGIDLVGHADQAQQEVPSQSEESPYKGPGEPEVAYQLEGKQEPHSKQNEQELDLSASIRMDQEEIKEQIDFEGGE